MEIKNLTKKQRTLILSVVLPVSVGALYLVNNQARDYDYTSKDNKHITQEQDRVSTEGNSRYVEITGQVTSPGVYEVSKQLMVIELIELAGGLTEFADLEVVHKDISLSGIIEDRQKIYIPALSEFKNNSSNSLKSVGGENSAKININTATQEQLDSLPDIGPSTAGKIISARPFEAIEDLKDVEGIGEKTYNNLISVITL